jgi:hypothetical protein
MESSMPRRVAEEDEWDDDEDEWDSEEGEASDDDEEPTIPCPYCKRQIHEDSQRCLFCEKYISEEDATASRKPWWIIVGVCSACNARYRWIVG